LETFESYESHRFRTMSTLGFWNFVFNYQDWMKNIENCSSKAPEEWKTYIPPYSFSVGLAYLIIGVLMEVMDLVEIQDAR